VAGGWAIARGAGDSWRRFREAWAAMSPAAWHRWLGVLIAGFALTALLMAALALAADHLEERGLAAWDRAQLLQIERSSFLSFHSAIWWQGLGASSMLLPVVALAMVLAARAGRPMLALSVLATYLAHEPIVLLGWNLWERARPELIAGGIAAPPLGSFPSGHMVQVVAVYGLFLYLWARCSGRVLERLLVLALGAALAWVVGLARLRMGTHWPSDIAAGAVVGAAWLLAVIAAQRSAERAGGR
jgi:membrane-associated phospholipid phosphatase